MRSAFSISNLANPERGGIALPFVIDFSAGASQDFDITADQWGGQFDFVQSIWIDNRANGQGTIITFAPLNYVIFARQNQQGIYPVIMPDGTPIRFNAASTGGAVKVPIILLNIPWSYVTWAGL